MPQELQIGNIANNEYDIENNLLKLGFRNIITCNIKPIYFLHIWTSSLKFRKKIA